MPTFRLLMMTILLNMALIVALGEPLPGQAYDNSQSRHGTALLVDLDGNSTRLAGVSIVTRATGRWEGGVPPRQGARTFWIYVEGSQGGGTWNDQIEVNLADVTSLSFTGNWDCLWMGPELQGAGGVEGDVAGLEVLLRDGRRISLSYRAFRDSAGLLSNRGIYTSFTRDGTQDRTAGIYTWRLHGSRVSDAKGQTTGSIVQDVVGRALNPLGRESDFSIPVCRIRTIHFD